MNIPIKNYRIKNYFILFLIKIIDRMGYSFFNKNQPLGHFKRIGKKKAPKKILIVKSDDLGDLILITPFVYNLKKKFPKAKITLLLKSSTRDVFLNNPFIDKIFVFEPFWMRSKKPFTFVETINLVKKLKKQEYDLIFELREYPQNILFDSLLKSKYLISRGAQGLGFFATTLIPPEEKLRHKLENNLDILRFLGIPIYSKTPRIYLSNQDRKFSKDVFLKHKISNKDFVICVHIGAPWIARMWPKERYAKLINNLIKKYNSKVILIGAKGELKLNEELIRLIKNKKNITNLTCKTSITQLCSIIEKCNLFIGNDSGPMHIASATKTKIIGLFGPQTPKLFGPWGKKNTFIYKKISCSPCIQKLNKGCKFGYTTCKALLKIEKEDILKEVKKWKNEKVV